MVVRFLTQVISSELCHSISQIVMCLLVSSAPKSNLAMPALDVLNKAVALFETGVETGSIHMSENMVTVLDFVMTRNLMLTPSTGSRAQHASRSPRGS